MIRFLFWNLLEKPQTADHVVRLARTHGVDVLLFAECPEDLLPILNGLNGLNQGLFCEVGARVPPGNPRVQEPRAGRTKVRVVSRLPPGRLHHIFTGQGRNLGIWRLVGFTPAKILIAAVHMPPKGPGGSSVVQQEAARDVSLEIQLQERHQTCRDTLLIGDLNMNPWDPGMVMVSSFHGVMTQSLATRLSARGGRRFRGERYPCFYNPMWGRLGDLTPGPGGTFFWEESAPDNHHWHMLDQALLRPSLLPRFRDVQILDSDGQDSLLTPEGVASKSHISDHLPILLDLDI